MIGDNALNIFQLPPLDSYVYFSMFWVAMSQSMPVNIISAEQLSLAPYETLSEIIDFYGLERSSEEIVNAVISSNSIYANSVDDKVKDPKSKSYKSEVNKYYTDPIIDFFGQYGQLNLDMAMPFTSDCLELLKSSLSPKVYLIAVRVINATRMAHPLSYQDIARLVSGHKIENLDLLQLCAVLQGVYYVENFFTDLQLPMAQKALDLFVNLNIYYLHYEPIANAAKHRLIDVDCQVNAE